MALPTNRKPGDIIQAVDVNQIAEAVNEINANDIEVIVSETQPAETNVLWIDPSDEQNYDRRIFGAVPPNGVVSAPPGWEYVDETGTNGAWVWRKRWGTWNTGWFCVEGDTGLRYVDLSPDPKFWRTSDSQATTLRRVGNVVSFTHSGRTEISGESGVTFLSKVPLGFRPTNAVEASISSFDVTVFASGNSVYSGRVSSSGEVYGRPILPGRLVQIQARYVTDNPWPTTLPGIAQ